MIAILNMLADVVYRTSDSGASHRTLSIWGIIFLIVFLLWALGCVGYSYNPADVRLRWGFGGLLVILVGMLGACAAGMISFVG